MDVSFFERFLLLTFIHLASSNPEIEEDEILQYPWIGLQGGLESSLERPTYNRLHIRREHCECPCNMGTPVPLVTEATVPVITIVGTSVIDVPCSYAGSTITGASLQVQVPHFVSTVDPFISDAIPHRETMNRHVVCDTAPDFYERNGYLSKGHEKWSL